MLIAVVLAALAGVALLGVPGSPFHRSLKQGLDLQGGLEVVLQAKPAKGQTVTPAEISNSISIMRTRVDKLGVSEPVITKQGSDQIVIELPAVHDPAQAASIIGKTAQLELYDLTPSLLGPSIDASQNPVPNTSLFDLLELVQAGQKGPPSAYYLFNSRTKRVVAGPDSNLHALKRDPQTLALKPVEPKTVTIKTKATKTTKAKTTTKVIPPGKTTPGFPTGYQVLTVPPRAVVITCDSTVAPACPGLTTAPVTGVTYYYLFKHGRYPLDPESPYPADDGQGPAAVGDAGGRRPDERAPDRDDPVHRQGQQALPPDHPGRGAARAAARRQPELRGRARQPDLLVPDDRLHPVRGRDRPDRDGRRDHRDRLEQGGPEPRARPPDRRPAGQVRHGGVVARVGDPREGLAPPGPDGGDRGPDPRRALPARALPLPRPRRGDRPRRLRGVHVRRDPAPRRRR